MAQEKLEDLKRYFSDKSHAEARAWIARQGSGEEAYELSKWVFAREYAESEREKAEAAVERKTQNALTERSTIAAEDSALSAKRSARLAGWAIVISLVALAFTGWPYLWFNR